MKIIPTLACAALLSASLGAQAGESYWGASLGQYEFDFGDEQADAAGLNVLAGYGVNEWVDIQGRLGTTDGADFSGTDVSAKYYATFLVRAMLPMQGGQAKPYVAGGFTSAKVDGGGDEETFSGGAYGIGIDFSVGGETRFAIEWLHLFEDDVPNTTDVELDVQSISLIYMRPF